jgi:hyperosmotically inducible protein
MIYSKRNALVIGLLMAMGLPVFAATTDSTSSTTSDTVITSKVKSELALNSATHALNISVNTTNGVVTLSGTVGSNDEATTAVQIAETTKNVKDVDASNLTITGNSQPMTDAYITAKVKGVFIRNYLIPNTENVPVTEISVDTQQGVVHLSGTVKHHWQVTEAVKLAKAVNGVTQVVSTLKVA